MKEALPVISVVVLNHNGLKYLKETIPAVLGLSYPNFEFSIVDNGSSDGSVDFIKRFEKIKLIEVGENLGYSKGKNLGIRHASGEYILSLDEDILITDRDLLQKLIHAYSPQVGFLQVPLVDRGKEETFYYGTYYSIYGLNMHRPSVSIKKILGSGTREICGPTGGFVFASVGNFQKIGFFDESQMFHLDDVDIGPRSSVLGFKNYLLTDSYCEHLGIGKTIELKNFLNRFKFLFSGHARAMVKNFNLINLVTRFPILLFFHIAKAVRFSITKRSLSILGAFLWSVNFFFQNLPDTIRNRKLIQSKRVSERDIFLNIKPPRFNQ